VRELLWGLLAAGVIAISAMLMWLIPTLAIDTGANEVHGYHDSLVAALQLGRLDLVSILLTVVALIVGVAAIFGFGYIRSEAHRVAKEEARVVAAETAQNEVQRIVPALTRRTIAAYSRAMAANDENASETTGAVDDELQALADALRREDDPDDDGSSRTTG
jgi:hypothetical protein